LLVRLLYLNAPATKILKPLGKMNRDPHDLWRYSPRPTVADHVPARQVSAASPIDLQQKFGAGNIVTPAGVV
jgi:hypothetical protein